MSDSTERAPRSRTAPRAVTSSDVTRFRGTALGVAATAIAAVAMFASGLAADTDGSPGPLSVAHQRAELACETCHGERAPAAVCGDCHAGHGSRRAPHAARAAAGELTCTTCHDPHHGDSLVFAPDGSVARGHGGALAPLATTSAFRPTAPVTVTLVSSAACARCHDPTAALDPLGICLGDDPGTPQPALCFDEHAAPTPDGLGDRRTAAYEAARRVLEEAPPPLASAPQVGAYLPMVLGLAIPPALGLLVMLGVRTIRRRRDAPKRATVVPIIAEKVRLPQIDANTCLGCYACVDACPYDVLAVEDYVAVVVRPKDCCGLTLCEQVCPNGSLTIADGAAIDDRPNVGASLESLDQPGLYLAGDLTGAPLIRNAIHQGALAVKDIVERSRRTGDGLDLVIVGAGPAGISAALAAKAAGLRYEVLEQGSVAESIRSFPRGKLVFDQPVSMPIAGDLWLAESTKEELLAKWLRIVHRERLAIREGHRVTAVRPPGATGGFTVESVGPDGEIVLLRAARVVLALGRRGTPRKLAAEVPDAALDRVHYSLADARSHAGMRTIVVGLGDVAMEAAIALARQPGTSVTVVYRGEGFSRGKARNVSQVERLVREGRITLRFSTEVERVEPGRAWLRTGDGSPTAAPFDALFVMIGSLPPWPFLEAAGVRRVGDANIEAPNTEVGPRPEGGSASEDGPAGP